jgi:hypothetical protein
MEKESLPIVALPPPGLHDVKSPSSVVGTHHQWQNEEEQHKWGEQKPEFKSK